MTHFIINENITASGEMSVQQQLVNGTIIVTGTIELDKYIDDIDNISSERFEISGVTVIKEYFGTSDEVVIYEFKATGLYVDENSYKGRI